MSDHITPHEELGDEDLRQHILDEWAWISIVDDEDNEVTRLEIDDDDRSEWEDAATENPMTVSVELSGDDADIDVSNGGVTIEASFLHLTETDTDRLSGEIFDQGSFTIAAEGDTVQIEHDVYQPVVEV